MSNQQTMQSIPSAPSVRAPATEGDAAHRRAGRFRESRRTRVMRAALGGLSTLAPGLAAQVGYRMLATPPRVAERAWQRRLRLDARSHRLSNGGGTVAVYEWGAAAQPALLMVHGWGARATHMGRMIPPLVAAGFRVVAFDAPAHGESTGRTTDVVEFAAVVHQVARFAGALHGVIAHSFGAAMAQLAVRDWGLAAERHVLVSSLRDCNWFCDAFGRYAGLPTSALERMKAMLVERHNGRFDWARTSTLEMLRRVDVPVLLIHDEEDAEIPFAHSVALRDACPRAELLATRGLGHQRLLSNAAVIERVVRFMAAS